VENGNLKQEEFHHRGHREFGVRGKSLPRRRGVAQRTRRVGWQDASVEAFAREERGLRMTLATFFQLDRRITNLIDVQLSASIPLAHPKE
jgi:hypothetical protein